MKRVNSPFSVTIHECISYNMIYLTWIHAVLLSLSDSVCMNNFDFGTGNGFRRSPKRERRSLWVVRFDIMLLLLLLLLWWGWWWWYSLHRHVHLKDKISIITTTRLTKHIQTPSFAYIYRYIFKGLSEFNYLHYTQREYIVFTHT